MVGPAVVQYGGDACRRSTLIACSRAVTSAPRVHLSMGDSCRPKELESSTSRLGVNRQTAARAADPLARIRLGGMSRERKCLTEK